MDMEVNSMRREFKKVSDNEIEARKKMYEKADALGIDLLKFDSKDKEVDVLYKQDVNQAILFLVSGKDIPQDLEQRLMEKKKILVN